MDKCRNKNIAYIFYDPYEKIFRDPIKKNKLDEIDFSDEKLNLDLEKNNEEVENWFGDINLKSKKTLLNKKRERNNGDYDEIKETFDLLIEKLKISNMYSTQNDSYSKYNSFQKDIINLLQIDQKKEEIILITFFYGKDIEAPFPDKNYLFLCNKKNSKSLLLSVNYNSNIYVFDYDKNEKIDGINKGLNLIDREKNIIIMKIHNKV